MKAAHWSLPGVSAVVYLQLREVLVVLKVRNETVASDRTGPLFIWSPTSDGLVFAYLTNLLTTLQLKASRI